MPSLTDNENNKFVTTGEGPAIRSQAGGVYKASPQAVSDGERTDILTDELGQQKVVVLGTSAVKRTAGTAVLTNVASSASSVQLLAANGGRMGAIIVNDSTAILRIAYGTTASATVHTVSLAADEVWVMPDPVYTGELQGIWESANGAARITELT